MKLSKPQVVIVGAGFGGLSAVKKLKNANMNVIVIDKSNHHLFQPLLYQVATSALSPGDIAIPIRTELRRIKNSQVIMNEVISVDIQKKLLHLDDGDLNYDYLILAPGARHSYFNNPEWERHALGLKSMEDALKIREKVLLSFEKAERSYGTSESKKYTTFVVVGGGPTGVELAGAIAEIARKTMLPDFPLLRKDDLKIILIEAGDRLVNTYPAELSEYTEKALKKLGVEIIYNTTVIGVDENGVELKYKSNSDTLGFNDLEESLIVTANVIWAAGNSASSLMKSLGTELDWAGRAIVNKDCSLPGYNDVFVIGDSAHLKDEFGNILPGIAPVAIQQGEFVAGIIKKRVPPDERKPFRYKNRGVMATIGRAKAIALFPRNIQFKGFTAWIMWCLLHVFLLIDFRNRFRVMFEWFWYYISFKPGARLIIYNRK